MDKSDRDMLQLIIIFALIMLLIVVILIRKADSSTVWELKQSDPIANVYEISWNKPERTQSSVIASYYTYPFHTRQTANGEIYNMHDLTAAHKTLPFDTVIMITNEKNGYIALARINDRGPFIAGRELDVSLAIAEQLDMVMDGITKVNIDVLYKPE